MQLAGVYGDGLVFAIPPRGTAVPEAMAHVRQGATQVGRSLEGFRTCALTNIVLLEPGEAVDAERVIRLIGPNVMASVYYFFDAVHEHDIEPPDFLKPYWQRYCDLVAETPAAYWHLRTHEYHYTTLHPGEAELIDAELIRATCLVGTAEELIGEMQEWERQGLQELMFATGNDEKWRFAEALRGGHGAVVGRTGRSKDRFRRFLPFGDDKCSHA
jgi:alkanesulfonate monooxygenase SsuD/methylene tetrahydromethanopterin reductase-like flavin-dependent oxidoreductase (luciferase family)